MFVLAVVGASILLNSPTVRSGDTMSQIVEQQQKEKFNTIKFEKDDSQLAIEDELED